MTTGGKSQGVYVVTDEDILAGRFRVQPGPALRVVGITPETRGVMGGPSIPVYIVNDPAARGVIGGKPIPVSNLTSTRLPIHDLAIPVYVVSDDGQFEAMPSFVGPYDAYSDQITVAYSTRRLFSAYTGKSFRVIRTSDNDEFVVPFTELGVLDTVELASFLNGSSGLIKIVYDQKGTWIDDDNGTDGEDTESIDGQRMVYVESSINGKPGFDSTFSFPSAPFFVLNPDLLDNKSAVSALGIVSYIGSGEPLICAERSSGVTGPVIVWWRSSPNNYQLRSRRESAAAAHVIVNNSVTPSAGPVIHAATFDYIGQSVRQYINGLLNGQATGVWSGSVNSSFVDATRTFWWGRNSGGSHVSEGTDYGELLIGTNVAWDADTHAALSAIANDYWGVY